MAMRMGLLGKKLGMTQVFAEDGERIPVTVVQTGPNVVIDKRTEDKHGYSALVLGFDAKPERLANRPEMGNAKKSGVAPQRLVKEFRLPAEDVEKYEVGQELKAQDVFENGAPIDVSGVTKGRGFQGVMKRHGMSGTKASHGVHEYFRHGGSIGMSAYPARVIKGKKMAGQHGNCRVTVQNLRIAGVRAEDNAILIRGSVPGPNGGTVLIRAAIKKLQAG